MKSFIKLFVARFRHRKKCKIGFHSNISFRSRFEGMNKICSNVHFDGYLGYGSYISPHCDIAMTRIGRFSSIGPRVVVNPGRHPYTYPYVTTSPAFFSCMKQNSGTFTDKNLFDDFNFIDKERQIVTEIGNDCWIGDGAFIVGGVHIGDGAVILAHAVVTKDIPPYAIVGGVPAKVLSFRYSEDDIEFLLNSKWWLKDDAWFKKNIDVMNDFGKFKKEYHG